jgi:hypothetical protein
VPASGPRPVALALGAVVWAALGLQLVLSLQLSGAQGRSTLDGIVTFLSFFTILTNILVALTLTAPPVAPASAIGRFFARPTVGAGVASLIAVVGLTYVTLLRNVWNPQGWQLVADLVLHYVTPVLFVVYWWFALPKAGLQWRDLRWQLAFPLSYLGYALARGALTGRYPYYFIDAGQLGYARTAVNAVAITVLFLAVAAAFIGAAQAQGRQS